jgi:hypothetical protein
MLGIQVPYGASRRSRGPSRFFNRNPLPFRRSLVPFETGSDWISSPHAQSGKREGLNSQMIGARLLRFKRAWEAIGRAYLIRRGLQPEWKRGPPPSNVHLPMGRIYSGAMHANFCRQLQAELNDGTVVEVRREQCKFLSPTFLVPKKGNEWRKVIDCRRINHHIQDITFQMEDHRTAAQVIERNQYAVSVDIKEAYHHIPVSQDLRQYLSFAYAGKFYQYRGMPFGVKHAPRVFTRIMHAAMVEVRKRWEIQTVQYLDDLLFLSVDPEDLQLKIREIVRFLEHLGWIINLEKSNFFPSQQFIFLGLLWDTQKMEVMIEETRNGML